MAESECYSLHKNDSDDHNHLSVYETFTHPSFRHSIFSSVTFREFQSRVNNWKITHNNLHAEESVGTRQNSALTPMFGRLNETQSDNKKIIK